MLCASKVPRTGGMGLAHSVGMEAQPVPTRSNLRAHLLDDHRHLEEDVAQLVTACKANDQTRMQELWSDFEPRLLAHFETEERSLLPALLDRHSRAVRVIFEEHRHIRRRVEELGEALDLHQVRLESLCSFFDELRAHAATEDRLMYQWADEALSDSEQTKFLADLAETLHKRLEKLTQ
jgi:hemerythrin